jgi:hypothetical protein
VALAAIPSLIAVWQLGRIHPDEVYQYLEPAFWRVHGYGVMAWEWHRGLRNWAVPGVIAACIRVAELFGLSDPRAVRAVIALPQWALNVFALVAVFRFSRRRVPEGAARLALALVALTGSFAIYAGRTLGESLSAALLWIAFEALDRAVWPETSPEGRVPRWARGPAWAGAVAGMALGLSVVARYGSALFVVAAVGWLFAMRRWRPLIACVVAGALVALGLGALDWVSWGAPFHSLVAYLQYNVFSGDAARQFGSAPASFYFLPLLALCPLWALAGIGLSLRYERPRVSAPLVASGVYLLALLATAHKEERFLYPGVAVLWLAAAPWVARAVLSAGRWRGVAVGAALVASGVTFAFGPELRGDQFRGIVEATRGDAHGLVIVNEGLWGAGGFFYVGKRIPWFTCDWPRDASFRNAMRDRRFDRAVTFEGRALDELKAAGFRVMDQVGRETVLAR